MVMTMFSIENREFGWDEITIAAEVWGVWQPFVESLPPTLFDCLFTPCRGFHEIQRFQSRVVVLLLLRAPALYSRVGSIISYPGFPIARS